MSAGVRTSTDFAGLSQLELLCALVREDRARRVRPGSEQEIVWHALVPAEFRREAARAVPLSPPLPAVAGAGDPTTAAEPTCNPS